MRVFIMRGVSGSGKSTLTKEIGNQLDGIEVVSADHYFQLPRIDVPDRSNDFLWRVPPASDAPYDFDPAELGYAHAYSMRAFIAALEDGDDVVVDNTNTSAVEIAPYLLVAQSYRAEIVIIHVKCDVATAIARAAHGAPSHVIEAMAARLEEPLPPYWPREIAVWGDMPLDVFRDLSEMPDAGGSSILQNVNGVTSVVYDDAPYAGHQDDNGNWIYTRQALIV